MPSSSKSPQALPTKSHSFLRKSTDASPSRTTSPSVPSEARTSQSTVSLNPRYNESNHPEEDDDEKTPEEMAAAELRANRRSGYDPNSSLDENNMVQNTIQEKSAFRRQILVSSFPVVTRHVL